MDNIFNAIRRERAHQDDKYGANRHMPIRKWFHILCDEMEEVMEAADKRDDANALCEMLQVAAVAVACLEDHGVVERKYSPVDEHRNTARMLGVIK